MSFWVLKLKDKRSYFKQGTNNDWHFVPRLAEASRFKSEEAALFWWVWRFSSAVLTFVEAREIKCNLKATPAN